jgi:carbon monoxide dehydrogenase subunit G
MAVTLTKSVTINRPREQVFAFISDFRNLARVGSGVSRVEHAGGPETGLGAKYRTYGKIAGRNTDGEMEVIEWDPPNSFAARGTFGRVPFTDRFTLEPVGMATRVTQVDTNEPSGLFKALGFVYGPVVGWFLQRDLKRMKAAVEAG